MTRHSLLSQRRQTGRKSLQTLMAFTGAMTLVGGPSLAAAATCTVPTSHPTIQAAVDDPACTRVNVRPGVYEPFTIDRAIPIEVVGSGANTIVQAPPTGVVGPPPHAIIRIYGASTEATVRNFTVQGPVNEGVDELTGIFVGGDAAAVLKQNRVLHIREDGTGTGLGFDEDFIGICIGSDALGETGHATVINNRVERYQKAGIVVDGDGSTATLLRNTVTGSVRVNVNHPVPYGIQISRGALAEATKNRVFDNGHINGSALSVGILLFEAANNVELTNNIARGNDTGICVKQTNEATLIRNEALDSVFDGISLDNQDPSKTTNGNILRRNTALRNGEGITVFSSHSNLFDRNTSNDNNGAGFFVTCDDDGSGCTGPKSSGNQFQKNVANNNGILGYEDESTGGGTSGTANFYNGNKCSGNGDDPDDGSEPDGLCSPQN